VNSTASNGFIPPETSTTAGRCSGLRGSVLIALCWVPLLNLLLVDWSVNPEYGFGWFVPPIAVVLFWLRWRCRPEPEPAPASTAAILLASVALLCLLPLRLVEEANPDWRRAFWYHGILLSLLSAGVFWHLGGRPWARHFAFPICFLLTSVPWPVGLEVLVTQRMMRYVAAVTVEVVGWLGIPAVRSGNVVEISTGLVGIDEACSGVRSLQTSVMIGFLLGEIYRLKASRRGWLLLGSVVLAFFINVGRTSTLTWSASRQDFGRMNALHDAAGLAEVFLALAGIWTLAILLRQKTPVQHQALASSTATRILGTPVLVAVFGWLLSVEAINETWYRAHEAEPLKNIQWTINSRTNWPGWRKVPIPERSLAILRCSDAASYSWRDASGGEWRLNHLRWPPSRNSAHLAKGHRPDICLPSAGWTVVEQRGKISIPVHGLNFALQHGVYQKGGQPANVFYGLWENDSGRGGQDLPENNTVANRLSAVLHGKRNRGQQVLEILITGASSPLEALTALQETLGQLIERHKDR
jgi:exosortase